ncbi:hypothetical protein Tco_0860528 [Tanacetum coccineum]|uniref:Uncharacterized protein n=1 Tax=Tanacetum coccineum TaxID=301880 RepID=A0ABQ5BIL8_9ASTR
MCVAGYPYPSEHGCKDTAYFDRLLQLHKAYRISGFNCEQTGLWERTLNNPTSLIFGRFIQLKEVPAEDFPSTTSISPATMNLKQGLMSGIQYSQVPNQYPFTTVKNTYSIIKTDYIGRIQAVSRIRTSRDATSNRIHQRIIDIQNLRPVVIAVSSCWVRQFHGLQLFSTSATHYYLNPNIPETFHIKQGTITMFVTWFSDNTNTLIRDCNDILAELPNKDPYELPSTLKELEGTKHVFQFHFDSGSSYRRRNLVLDRVFEISEPTAAPISENQPEAIQHTKPLSPALSTTASNQPEVVEPETAETKEPQSTSPTTPETVKPIREINKQTYRRHLPGSPFSKLNQKLIL